MRRRNVGSRARPSGVPSHSQWVHDAVSLIQAAIGEGQHRSADVVLQAVEQRMKQFAAPPTAADGMVLAGVLHALRARAQGLRRMPMDVHQSPEGSTEPARLTLHGSGHPKVQQALQQIAERYTDPSLRLGDVARDVHLSPFYLDRLLARNTGAAFVHHLRTCRLRRAVALLESTHSIKQIAGAVGYRRASSFNRDFRRVHGLTPTQWRRATRSR